MIRFDRVEIKHDGPLITKTEWKYVELPPIVEDHIEDNMSANEKQVGGDHYKIGGEEHWDRAWRLKWDPFQYQITKYVERWKDKGGVQDLKKAQHFLEKYIELVEAAIPALAKGDIDMMLAVPQTLTYEGGSFVEDMWQCKLCRLHLRSKRGTLPDHDRDTCIRTQQLSRGTYQDRNNLSRDSLQPPEVPQPPAEPPQPR